MWLRTLGPGLGCSSVVEVRQNPTEPKFGCQTERTDQPNFNNKFSPFFLKCHSRQKWVNKKAKNEVKKNKRHTQNTHWFTYMCHTSSYFWGIQWCKKSPTIHANSLYDVLVHLNKKNCGRHRKIYASCGPAGRLAALDSDLGWGSVWCSVFGQETFLANRTELQLLSSVRLVYRGRALVKIRKRNDR